MMRASHLGIFLALAVLAAAAFLLLRSSDSQETVSTPPSDIDAESDDKRPADGTGGIESRRFEPEQAPSETDPEQPPTLVVTGRVVDERRHPQAAIVVTLKQWGHEDATSRTGPDGAFRFAFLKPRTKPTSVSVHARDDKRAGVGDEYFRDDRRELDVGTIVLSPVSGFTVQVNDRGAPIVGAEVLIGLPGWYRYGPYATDDRGQAVIHGIPPGEYDAIAIAPERRGTASLTLPRSSAAPVLIELEATRDVEILVERTPSGEPVQNAHIVMMGTRRVERGTRNWPLLLKEPPAPTDADGRTVVRGIPQTEGLTVRARAFPGSPPTAEHLGRSGPSARIDKPRVVIQIPEGRRMAFHVGPGEVPPPSDGTELQLSLYPGYALSGAVPPTGRIVGSDVVVLDVGRGVAGMLARTPDGALARLHVGRDGRETGRGQETSFRRPRTIGLTVRNHDGSLASGLHAQLRTVGNVEFGPIQPLDKNGRAEFRDLHGSRYELTLRRPHQGQGRSWQVATVDIEKTDAEFEVTLEPPREIVLRLRVDGVRRLPAKFGVHVTGGAQGEVTEDADAAELRLEVLPFEKDRKLKLTLAAGGYPRVVRDIEPEDQPAILDIDLVKGATAKIVCTPPSDGEISLRLEAWNEKRGRWATTGGMLFGRAAQTERRFTGLHPGSYRAVDGRSGIATESVELGSGTDHTFTLDLTGTGWVEGRVEVPEGEEARTATVHLSGDRLADVARFPGDGARVRTDGSFRVRVPGDRPVSLSVRHPMLVPDPDAGRATVTRPRSGIALRLVRGAMVKFLLSEPPPRSPSHRIMLFKGAVEGDPAHTCDVTYDGAIGRFGGFKPGTWTVWCDLPPRAPLVLRDIALNAESDLGLLHPKPGASVRVTVHHKPDDRPRTWVSARHQGTPPYDRRGSGTGAEIILPGLGPGRFEVNIGGKKHVVLSDGRSTISLVHDLR